MQPDGTDSQREGVLNPGVARDRQHNLLLFPRLVAAGNVSTIGLVRVGKDLQVERVSVILEPQTNYEIRDQPGGYGCEDSRVTYIAELDQYVMAYTAFGPSGARIAVAASSDAYMWTRLGLIEFHDDGLNAVDNKDAAFFPEVVLSPNGIPSIAFFHRPMRPETINGQTPIPIILALPPQERESICIAYVPLERVRRNIRNICSPVESTRALEVGENWGKLKNGAGTPPVRTPAGWLSVFHAVDAVPSPQGPSLSYSAGIMINDLQYPHRLVYRSPEAVLVPETTAERFGTVDDVVFPTGIDEVSPSTFDIYYGAADARISRARFELK